MNPRPNNIRRKDKGFTLLELVIAMGILAAVVSMVFGIARTSLQLGNTIVETQAEEMKHQAFFELLHNRFSSLPGNARLDIQVESSSPPYISQVTIEDVPLSFTWGGQELIAEAVKLSTVKRRSGYLDIVLSYYEEKILDSTDEDADSGSLVDQEPFAEIILLRDVAYFEWRALDSTTLEWQYDWEISTRLPIQLELVMAIGAQGEEIREIFWLPPKENPETVIEQMLQTGNSGSSTGSSSSDRDSSSNISIPTTGDGK
ncbi:MAG: PulJ/GspJ family protein [Verrucomicrobiales bacterium]|nr:prepilin-type N-terminal cleavage/methylation domain-containing protein [Verrucomicrobiota bacterium JB025]